ncbi:MAG: hypothetical protein IT425_00210 [Pirellulales bacterium]|nr:hypothetical protein [Pirellulales bacterium]
MKRFLSIATLALIALATSFSSPAAAQCGGAYGYWDGGYGYLYNSLRYEVPHFAAFPPVYYSVPVPRTYGYSPFAYPPHVMTPEVAAEAQPLTIDNPFVPSPSAPAPATSPTPAKAPADHAASAPNQPAHSIQPLVIINPFVTRGQSAATSKPTASRTVARTGE